MRWPFRRKGTESVPESAASHGGPPEPPARRPGRQWVTLPPLPTTVDSYAPLVMGPAPVLPPLPGKRLVSGPPIAPAAGRVEGLATAVPQAPEPPPAPAASTQQPLQRPIVHRPVRSGPTTPSSALTDAVGPYVGEPREPAEPYRAPEWLRYTPSWLEQGGPAMDLGLGSDLPASTPEPPRPAPAPMSSRPIVPPSRVAEGPQHAEPDSPATPASTVDTPAPAPADRPRRRASLAQSRRLGLGAPLKHTGEQELVLPPEPQVPPAQAVPTPEPTSQQQESSTATSSPTPAASSEAGEDDGDVEEPPPPQPPPQPPPLRHRPASGGAPESVPANQGVASQPVIPAPAPVAPSSVPLVYRSAPGKRERKTPSTERVPSGLAAAIRSRGGVDVADVPVHRGPQVAAEARSLGARAFTKGGEVFLPEEAGSLESPRARGLLAHELVHAAQQRTLGSSLPALSTPAGAVLEAEAVAAEHEHAGHGHSAAPLVHPALTQVISQAARSVGVQLAPLVPDSVSFSSVPEVSPVLAPSTSEATSLSDPVREEIDLIAKANAIQVVEQWTNPDLGGTGFTTGGAVQEQFPGLPPGFDSDIEQPPGDVAAASAAEAEMANQILQIINMDRAAKGQPSLAALDTSTMEQVRTTIADQNATARAMMFGTATAAASQSASMTELEANQGFAPAGWDGQPSQSAEYGEAAIASDVSQPSSQAPASQPSDEESALRDGLIDIEKIDLEELSTRLYERLRSRLRLELLVDRERAGLLTDFR